MLRAQRNTKTCRGTTETILFLIWLTSFSHDWKAIKKQIEKSKAHVYEKCYTDKKLVWFKYFPWISWAHYGKIMLRQVFFPNENQKSNHYFQIFSVTKFLTLSWRRPLSYWKQSIDLLCKSIDWFLYDNGLRHERVKNRLNQISFSYRNSFNIMVWGSISLNRFKKPFRKAKKSTNFILAMSMITK